MKKEFIGYYTPTEKEINDSWTNGTFSFDANTLLNLYRYTEVTRKDFLSALKTLQSKLFIPHQAAMEYHNNRIRVIEGIENSYSDLYKIYEEIFEKNFEPRINQFRKHPAIKIDNILKLHSEFLKKISAELDRRKKNHPNFKTNDNVLMELTDLFENSIGKEFSKQELKKIYDEGKERYIESIPPGYKDLENKQKKGERNMYGDLIIWKELIEYTKREKKPMIFVTDDRKEDWWTIENGKTIRPREELIKEFFDLTGIRILIYNADNFLHYAKEKKYVPTLKENTIKEVKETRVSDEKSYAVSLDKFEFGPVTPPQSLIELMTAQNTIKDYINQSYLTKQKNMSDFINKIEKNQKFVSDYFNEIERKQKTVSDLIEGGINSLDTESGRISIDTGQLENSRDKSNIPISNIDSINKTPSKPGVRTKKAYKKK